jgi:multicomponent Na+:H+ antiporter subunit D
MSLLQHSVVLIPLTLLLGAMLAAPLGVLRRSLAYPIAQTASGLSFLFALLSLVHVLETGTIRYHLGGWPPPIGIEYVMDALSGFMATVVTGMGFFVMIYSRRSIEKELPRRVVAFYSVALLFLGGLAGIVVTGDLFNLYVFLEIASLAGYALASVGDKRAPIAAFRYLMLGTVGASFYLLGVGYIHFTTGSLNMADVAAIIPRVEERGLMMVALGLIVTGFALKLALFPMHLWLPDAYTYASSAGTAFLASIGTKVSAYALIRVLYGVFEPQIVSVDLPVTSILLWLSVAAIVFGSVMAIPQNDMKRMLAYSSVAQIGYIGLGIGLASPLGYIGAVLHILNHAVMKGTLFLTSGSMMFSFGTTTISDIDQTMRRAMPYTSAAFAISALSMVGLPPTAGFFSKWYLVLASVDAHNWVAVVVIGLSTLLNAVYFFNILERMYTRRGVGVMAEANRTETPASMLAPTLVLASAVVALGIFSGWIVDHVIKLAIPTGL